MCNNNNNNSIINNDNNSVLSGCKAVCRPLLQGFIIVVLLIPTFIFLLIFLTFSAQYLTRVNNNFNRNLTINTLIVKIFSD